jgi:hypothetical protein
MRIHPVDSFNDLATTYPPRVFASSDAEARHARMSCASGAGDARILASKPTARV